MASDARLVALVRARNSAAFETLYDRYQRQIFSFCRHMLRDPEEAADVVQHTFFAAYDAIVSSEKPILLRAWLFTIARNRCYSILRSRSQHPSEEAIELPTEGLAAQVQLREELRQLLADVGGLPADQRTALILAELCTLSHQEIGLELGVPATKVKALVFQARESLLASRAARDTDCAVIREQLANSRGAALRRGNLRRHLRQCQGCRDYRIQLELQRRNLAVVLPLSASLALKDGFGGQLLGGGAAAVSGGGLLTSAALKGLALKPLLGGALAVLGAGGAFAVAHGPAHSGRRATSSASISLAQHEPAEMGVAQRVLGVGRRVAVVSRSTAVARSTGRPAAVSVLARRDARRGIRRASGRGAQSTGAHAGPDTTQKVSPPPADAPASALSAPSNAASGSTTTAEAPSGRTDSQTDPPSNGSGGSHGNSSAAGGGPPGGALHANNPADKRAPAHQHGASAPSGAALVHGTPLDDDDGG